MARKPSTDKRSSSVKTYYLILYNTLSCLGWCYVLVVTCLHLTGAPPPEVLRSTSKWSLDSVSQARTAYIRQLIGEFSKAAKAFLTPSNTHTTAMIPPQLSDVYVRMTTVYDVVGPAVAIIQTAAALEVVHASFGLVKSPLPTAIIQVYSRLFLVWGVAQKYEQSRHNAFYSTMILAWSETEVIRYAFYALSLARDTVPSVLLYLRYTTFYVLYPLGASSEALLILSSLPIVNPLQLLKDGSWSTWDYFRGAMFIVWWPGLFVMMLHMVKQRRRVYKKGGESVKLKSS